MFRLLTLVVFFASTAAAQVKESRHDMPSGIGTYRVEIRGLDLFLVESTGDDGAGELHEVEITLHGRQGSGIDEVEQWHRVTETAPFLHNRSRDDGDRLTSTLIEVGDRLQLRRRGDAQDYHLWIHDRPEATDRIGSMDFELAIRAFDLDCAGSRVCDFGDTGWTRMRMHIVLPWARIRATCGPTNTFPFGIVDDDASVLGGDVLRVSDVARIPDHLLIDSEGLGPHLIPLNGEICVATSTLTDWWAELLRDIDVDRDRRDDFLRDVFGGR